jgi:hypothetical protein
LLLRPARREDPKRPGAVLGNVARFRVSDRSRSEVAIETQGGRDAGRKD